MLTDVILQLPEELVKQAKAAGVLTDDAVARFLKAEIERYERRKSLVANMQHFQQAIPPFTADEIEAEIQAFRHERAVRRDVQQ